MRLIENRNLYQSEGDERTLLAVKVVDLSRVTLDYRNKFLPREMRLWKELDHPHLVRWYSSFQHANRIYMIMEYCSGGDLLAYIQAKVSSLNGLVVDEVKTASRKTAL